MEEATYDDFAEIGASPKGLTEKRRAFLILQKNLTEDSSEYEWERAQRIMYHIRSHVSTEHLAMYFKGFEEFLDVVDKNAPDILEEMLPTIQNSPPVERAKKKKELTEDDKLLESYYEIFPEKRPSKKGKE